MSASEPLSWLTLERYALGELSAAEQADVEARLAASAADREILAQIQGDQSALPPLPAVLRSRTRAWRTPLYGALAACAVAAAVFLMRAPPAYDGVKGSGVTLRLISDRAGSDPHAFHEGEHFKVALSCPASLRTPLRVLVFQGSERFEPLSLADLACGNNVSVPGAFALDGREPADVCVYTGSEPAPARSDAELVCTRLAAGSD